MAARFSENFDLLDRLQYFFWQLRGARNTFEGRFHNGPRISIRPRSTDDFDTAYDVFHNGIYETGLTPSTVHRIVDLGSNVGYTCVLWCWRYPAAKVIAFEPHPAHCEIINWHIRTNGYSERVKLVPAGAAAAAGSAVLSDQGVWSAVLRSPTGEVGSGGAGTPHNVPIELVDIFSAVGDEPIDILKMDIEGSEYEIMSDPRFEALARRTRCVVMEWHLQQASHLGGQWCTDRFTQLGFRVEQKPMGAPGIGMLVAHAAKSAD